MTYDPFKVEGPAVISFSGGRTSGYLLWRILQAHGGKLPADVIVCFQNTGKEMPETLDFVEECSQRWSVPIVWLEFDSFIPPGRSKCNFRIVTHATADRTGRPFSDLITALSLLPNPIARTCTSYLKIKTMIGYLTSIGWDEWDIVLGIRADEPGRVARLRNPDRDNRGGTPMVPLASANVSARDVAAFWNSQPFDLQLSNNNGKTMHGNCDLCFLKPASQVLSLIREKPSRAIWWIAQENKQTTVAGAGARFRNDRPTYQQMYDMATTHGELFAFDDESLIDCACTD